MASWRCLAGPRFRPIGLSLLRVSTAVAASIAIAGCDHRSVCVDGQLYADIDEDGIYTSQDTRCVQPDRRP